MDYKKMKSANFGELATLEHGETILLCVPRELAEATLSEWLRLGREPRVTIRKAKTKGHFVIETKDVLYAAGIAQWFSEVRVYIMKNEK